MKNSQGKKSLVKSYIVLRDLKVVSQEEEIFENWIKLVELE